MNSENRIYVPDSPAMLCVLCAEHFNNTGARILVWYGDEYTFEAWQGPWGMEAITHLDRKVRGLYEVHDWVGVEINLRHVGLYAVTMVAGFAVCGPCAWLAMERYARPERRPGHPWA